MTEQPSLDITGAATEAVGLVVGLFTASGQGAPMGSHTRIAVVPGVGIPGDRYATGQGYWSDPRWPDQELTLVDADVADALGIAAHQLRRNVVTRGVDLEMLIGKTYALGTAVLLGVRRCDPCGHLDALTRPGLARQIGTRGGLRVRILEGGIISVGDQLSVQRQAPAR